MRVDADLLASESRVVADFARNKLIGCKEGLLDGVGAIYLLVCAWCDHVFGQDQLLVKIELCLLI